MPTTRDPAGAMADTALAPVRAHMITMARGEADRVLAAARGEADALVGQAREDAVRAIRLASDRGRADARALAAAERSRGRGRARSIVLGAQRAAYDELRRSILAEVGRVRAEPGYGPLLARLTTMASRAAGPGATVAYPPEGGVIARSGQVVVDCSLTTLAERAVQALGDRVRDLWEP